MTARHLTILTCAHYEVLSPLGKGGMGEVYLAQDDRLDRRVALKVLSAASADDQDSLDRFIREAKAASALNHPNIITIHDIGDAAGTHFIAYEFVDGRTLRDVARSAPLDVVTAIDIGIQVTSALAEELLNALSKIDALKVAARTSAFTFKGKTVDIGTIARTLGVTSVLDGSIRRSGNRLRISVQLVNAADGYQVWSERYDREMRDVFELQDEITLAVVAALKLKLFGDERAAVLKRYTDNVEAYELFLKGRHHAYKYTAQGWQRAIELFEKAIALQPDYALAYAGIAAARGCQWFFGILPAERVIPQCKAGNAQALAIDDGLADAYLSLSMIKFFYDWDWRAAERAFIRSIELNPNNGEALSYYALFLVFDGRVDEAMAVSRKALALDPLAPLINMNIGWTYFAAGQTAEALQQAAKMIESDPEFYGAYWLQGAIHLSAGEYQAAVDQLRSAVSLGGHQVVVADLASACSLAGVTGEATVILDRLS